MSYKELVIGIKNNTKNKQVQQECAQILEENIMQMSVQFDKILGLLLNTNKVINQKQSLQQLHQILSYLEYSQDYAQSLKMISEYLRQVQLTSDDIIEQFINIITRLTEQKELASISEHDLMNLLGKVSQLFLSKGSANREYYTSTLYNLFRFIFFQLRNNSFQEKAFMSLVFSQDKNSNSDMVQLNSIILLELLDKLMLERHQNVEVLENICQKMLDNFDLFGEQQCLQAKTFFYHVSNTTDEYCCLYCYEKVYQQLKSQSQTFQVLYLYYYMKILDQFVNNRYDDQRFIKYTFEIIKYINFSQSQISKNQEASNCLLYIVVNNLMLLTNANYKIQQTILAEVLTLLSSFSSVLVKNDVSAPFFTQKVPEIERRHCTIESEKLQNLAAINDSQSLWIGLLFKLLNIITDNLKLELPGASSTQFVQLLLKIAVNHESINFIFKLFSLAIQLLNQKEDFEANFQSIISQLTKENKKFSNTLICKTFEILQKQLIVLNYVGKQQFQQLNQSIFSQIASMMLNNLQPIQFLKQLLSNKDLQAITWYLNLPLNGLQAGRENEQLYQIYHQSYFNYLTVLTEMTLQSILLEKNSQFRFYLIEIIVFEILWVISQENNQINKQSNEQQFLYAQIMFEQVFSNNITILELIDAMLSDESTELNDIGLIILQLIALQQNNVIIRQENSYQNFKQLNLLSILNEKRTIFDTKLDFVTKLLTEVFVLNIEQTDNEPVQQQCLQLFLEKIDDIIQDNNKYDQKTNQQQSTFQNISSIILNQSYTIKSLIQKININELAEKTRNQLLDHYSIQIQTLLTILQQISTTNSFYKNCKQSFIYIINLINRIQKLWKPISVDSSGQSQQKELYLSELLQNQSEKPQNIEQQQVQYTTFVGKEAQSADEISTTAQSDISLFTNKIQYRESVQKVKQISTPSGQTESQQYLPFDQSYELSNYKIQQQLFNFQFSLLLKGYIVLFTSNELDKQFFNTMIQTYFQYTCYPGTLYLLIKLLSSQEDFNKYVSNHYLIDIDDLQKIKLYHFEELIFMILFYIQDYTLFKTNQIQGDIIAETIINVQTKQIIAYYIKQLDSKLVVQQQLTEALDQFVTRFIQQMTQLDHILTDQSNNKQIIDQLIQQFIKDKQIIVNQTLKNHLYNILTEILSSCENLFSSVFSNVQEGHTLIQNYSKIINQVEPLTITTANGLQKTIQLLNKIYRSKQNIISVFELALEYFNKLDEINKYDKIQDDQSILDNNETVVQGKFVQTMPEMAYLFFIQYVLKQYNFQESELNEQICNFMLRELIRIIYNSFGITNCLYADQLFLFTVSRFLDDYEDNKQLVEKMMEKYFQQYKQNYYSVRSCKYLIQQILLTLLQLLNYNQEVFQENIEFFQEVSRFVYEQYSYDNLVLKYILFKQSTLHFDITEIKSTCQSQILNIIDYLMPNINHSGQSSIQKLLIACDITKNTFQVVNFPDCDDFKEIHSHVQQQYHRIQAMDTAYLEEFVLDTMLQFLRENQKSLEQLIIQLFINASRNYLQELSINGSCPINNQDNFIKFLHVFMEINGVQRYVYQDACKLFLNNMTVSDELAQCGRRYFDLIGQFIKQVSSNTNSLE